MVWVEVGVGGREKFVNNKCIRRWVLKDVFSLIFAVHGEPPIHHGANWPAPITLRVHAGRNATLRCAGVGADSLIRDLEWACRGCAGRPPQQQSVIASYASNEDERRLRRQLPAPLAHARNGVVDGGEDGRVTLSAGRSTNGGDDSFEPPFTLSLSPAVAEDTGEYLCLVNNRKRPNSVIRLLVQGKFEKC